MKTLKTLFLVMVMIFTLVVSVGAEPFLICDPAIENEQVTSYMLTINGDETEQPAPFKYDLVNLLEGDYEIILRAKNLWGVSEPVSLSFRKALPSMPIAIILSAE